MTIIGVLASFAGGIFGTAIGALPAFVFVGFFIIAGVAVQAAGGGNVFLEKFPWAHCLVPTPAVGPLGLLLLPMQLTKGS